MQAAKNWYDRESEKIIILGASKQALGRETTRQEFAHDAATATPFSHAICWRLSQFGHF
jgi:hypothetical protein